MVIPSAMTLISSSRPQSSAITNIGQVQAKAPRLAPASVRVRLLRARLNNGTSGNAASTIAAAYDTRYLSPRALAATSAIDSRMVVAG